MSVVRSREKLPPRGLQIGLAGARQARIEPDLVDVREHTAIVVQHMAVEQRASGLHGGQSTGAELANPVQRGERHEARDLEGANVVPPRRALDVIPQLRQILLRQHFARVYLRHRGARLAHCVAQALHREWWRVERCSCLVARRRHGIEQVVDAVDLRAVFNHALLAQLVGQLAQIRLRSVRRVADDGEQQHGREVKRRQARHIDEVADGLARHKLIHGSGSVGAASRPRSAIHAADLFGHEVQHLAHESLIRLGIADRVRQQQRGGLAQRAADEASSAAQRALRQREPVEQLVRGTSSVRFGSVFSRSRWLCHMPQANPDSARAASANASTACAKSRARAAPVRSVKQNDKRSWS